MPYQQYAFYVEHPIDARTRYWFAADQIKQANERAQQLATEFDKPVKRFDSNGGHSLFYPKTGAQ